MQDIKKAGNGEQQGVLMDMVHHLQQGIVSAPPRLPIIKEEVLESNSSPISLPLSLSEDYISMDDTNSLGYWSTIINDDLDDCSGMLGDLLPDLSSITPESTHLLIC